uniref:Uncharacterized protein n=1 Tax=Timema douglasi TaxID=61478 RepID=A0A7R8VUI8_TIMDO|nr:unnamed protein product [Timema douglasi]
MNLRTFLDGQVCCLLLIVVCSAAVLQDVEVCGATRLTRMQPIKIRVGYCEVNWIELAQDRVTSFGFRDNWLCQEDGNVVFRHVWVGIGKGRRDCSGNGSRGSGLKCYVCEELLDSSCGATYNGTTLTDCGDLLPNRACVTITESTVRVPVRSRGTQLDPRYFQIFCKAVEFQGLPPDCAVSQGNVLSPSVLRTVKPARSMVAMTPSLLKEGDEEKKHFREPPYRQLLASSCSSNIIVFHSVFLSASSTSSIVFIWHHHQDWIYSRTQGLYSPGWKNQNRRQIL